jgi:hypothetical protein
MFHYTGSIGGRYDTAYVEYRKSDGKSFDVLANALSLAPQNIKVTQVRR